MGWYTSVQDDIGQHLRQAGSLIKSEDLGFRVLRSKMSVLPLIGLPLLVLFLAAESGWADWLVRLLPPPVYAVLAFVVFSGALILIALAYWLATKPLALHRAIGLKDRWPQFIGAAGLGAIVLYILAGGATFQQTRSLYIGLLVWGVYIVADAATTLLAPRNRTVRLAVIVLAVAVALAVAFPRIEAIYTEVLNQVAARRALLLNEAQPAGAPAAGSPDTGSSAAQAVESGDIIANAPQFTPEQKAQAYINNGKAYYAVDDYRRAAQAYREALEIYSGLQTADSESVRQETAVALAGYARSLQKLGDREWLRWLTQACALDPGVAAECSSQ
jgi:tetratricopeptide (TPR) repeat protein